MPANILFEPLRLGALALPNRVIMPALTRMRAGAGGVPTPLNALYYAQRASAGLNITEATAISVQGHGYPQMPGIHTAEQIAGWRLVTNAVHANGGRIVLQIVHHGRWSHSSYNPDGSLPVAPSAIARPGHAYTPTFEQRPYETPRALEGDELPAIVADFRQAARNARAAGFDAVEVHGANGFLLDQFLQDGSNRRTDAYGGTLIEPRASSAGIADDASVDSADNASLFRHLSDGPVITAGGYTTEMGVAAIKAGLADAVAFGRMFIANPDLPERIRTGAAMNAFDRSTAYGGGARGYTDYPTLSAAALAA